MKSRTQLHQELGQRVLNLPGVTERQNALFYIELNPKASSYQSRRRLTMLNRRVLTSVVAALAITITTQSFAQDRGTAATPAAGAKAGAIQGTFTTSDAIPWKPVDPKHPGLMMFVVWGNPNEGASEILQKFPAGMDSGWHWHTAAYQGVVIQGKFTHTFKGAAPQTGGPGSVWSQPARQVHDDKCEEGGDCIVVVYFHGKLDFIPVPMKAQ
jgi:quercetin dioxygenase-like cupin family protein